jgi:hypothetical protein
MESWIDRYFESLATETGQSEALAIKRSNFPKALYRYRSLERLAYILVELRDGYVFLSKPADFNDPYDSAFSVSWEDAEKRALEEIRAEYGFDPSTDTKFFEPLGEKEREYEQRAFENHLLGVMSAAHGPGAPPISSAFIEIWSA